MLGRLRDLLTAPRPTDPADGEQWFRIAVCVLLLEVAKSDEDFSNDEQVHIVNTLSQRFDLSTREVDELIEIASEHRAESSDLWKFTNAVNQHCTPDEKMEIMEEIWRVVYVDGSLDAHEDHLAHKFARLLNLNHPQLIEAKLKVRDENR